MRRAPLRAFGIACAGLLAACGMLPTMESREPAPWVEVGSRQPASNSESLLLYFQHIRKLPASEFGREHESARQAYNRTRSEFNRVRFAMVLALPNTAYTDDSRALELLEPVAKNANGRLQGLALLVSAHLQEQRRLNTHVQGLEQKLDALKSLERRLIERNR